MSSEPEGFDVDGRSLFENIDVNIGSASLESFPSGGWRNRDDLMRCSFCIREFVLFNR